MMMRNTLLLLAGTFFLVRLLADVPVDSGPSGPALFSFALDNQPVVRSFDMTPVFGLAVIVLFVFWLFGGKKGR